MKRMEYWNDGVMGRKPTLQYSKPLPAYCFHSKNSRRTPSGPSKKQTLRPSGSTRSSRIFKPADLIFADFTIEIVRVDGNVLQPVKLSSISAP